MKCPYRFHKTDYPDSADPRIFHTSEDFEDCYGDVCGYWDPINGTCGKIKIDLTQDDKDK